MRDFAGGLVVHAAAGAAGFGIVYQIWREERASGLVTSPKVGVRISEGWIALSILLLWIGWFGFNPGSVLEFNGDVPVVAVTTFVSAASAFISIMFFKYLETGKGPGILYAVNGILMGLIIITPLAGFVSPGSAFILGIIGGPLYDHLSRKSHAFRQGMNANTCQEQTHCVNCAQVLQGVIVSQ